MSAEEPVATGLISEEHLEHPSVIHAAEQYAGSEEKSYVHKGFFAGAYSLVSNLWTKHKNAGSFLEIEDMESYHHELYLMGGDSDHKTVVSTDVLCGAAAYEAVQAYERHKHARRLVDDHEKSMQYINGYAMAEAVKLFEAHHNRHANPEEKQQIAARTAAHAQHVYEEVYMIKGETVKLKATRRY